MVASIVGDISILVNCVLFVGVIIVLFALQASPTAKILLFKKLGSYKNKTINFICHSDGHIEAMVQTRYSDGSLKTYKKGKGYKIFFMAKPVKSTANVDENLEEQERSRFITTPFELDGQPVLLSYAGVGVVTNPNVIMALSYADHVDSVGETRELKALIKIPQVAAKRAGLKSTVSKMTVLLPIDPRGIKRNFDKNWERSALEASALLHESIGAEESKKDGAGMFKLLLIMGVIVCIALGVLGVISGRLVG